MRASAVARRPASEAMRLEVVEWQGREDSNLRMPGSKPGALGLLATPHLSSKLIRSGTHATASAPRPPPPCPQSFRQLRQRLLCRGASSNSTKQPLPDPVRRGLPIRESAENTASTAGSRRRSTGSNAFPSKYPETKSAIFATGASRVKSGAGKVAGGHVDARIGQHIPGRRQRIGVSRSPTPSAQALWPRTNTGTSAPSCRPSAAAFHVQSGPKGSSGPPARVAASDEPPPKPPPDRNALFDADISTLGDVSCVSAAWPRARRGRRPRPRRPEAPSRLTRHLHAPSRTRSPQSSRRNTVCSS